MSRPWTLGVVGLCVLWVALLYLYAPGLHGLYATGLEGGLMLDDFPALAPLLQPEGLPADWYRFILSPTGPLGRPLSMLSFLANAKWSGEAFWQWKAVNLAVHGVNAGLLAAVAGWLLSARAPIGIKTVTVLALLVAAWWALHPLQVTTVLYTVQRMTQLAATFSLLGVLLYVRMRLTVRDVGRARWTLAGVLLGLMPLAALSKETGLLLPGLLLVLEFTVLAERGDAAVQRQARRWLLAFSALPLAIGLLWLTLRGDPFFNAGFANRPFSLTERVLTEARVLCLYAVQILVPSRARLGFAHDDLLLSTGLLSPPSTAAALAFLMLLTAAAWRARARVPLLAAGWLWFLVAHSLEGSVVPLELMFEHRNYLPSAGLLLGIVGQAAETLPQARRMLLGAATLAIGLNLVLAHGFVGDWRDPTRLATTQYQLHPRSPTAAAQFAERLVAQRDFDLALSVLTPLPGAGARLQRAHIECLKQGRAADALFAEDLWQQERVLSSYASTGLIELARLRLDGACQLPAATFRARLQEATGMPITIGFTRSKLYLYLAQLARQDGEPASAYAALEAAFDQGRGGPIPLLLGCEWLLADGQPAAASKMLTRAEQAPAADRFTAELRRVRALVTQAAPRQ